MKKQKTAILINAVTIPLEIFALAIRPDRYGIPALLFYTILSNLTALISSAFYLIGHFFRKEFPFVKELRFCACCTLTLTFLIVTLCLVWFTDPLIVLFEKNNLYHHILIPAMTFYSYIYCEPHAEKTSVIAFPMIYTLLYAVLLVILNSCGKVNGPYPFFMTARLGLPAVILICAGLGIVVYLLFRILYKISFTAVSKPGPAQKH